MGRKRINSRDLPVGSTRCASLSRILIDSLMEQSGRGYCLLNRLRTSGSQTDPLPRAEPPDGQPRRGGTHDRDANQHERRDADVRAVPPALRVDAGAAATGSGLPVVAESAARAASALSAMSGHATEDPRGGSPVKTERRSLAVAQTPDGKPWSIFELSFRFDAMNSCVAQRDA